MLPGVPAAHAIFLPIETRGLQVVGLCLWAGDQVGWHPAQQQPPHGGVSPFQPYLLTAPVVQAQQGFSQVCGRAACHRLGALEASWAWL